MHLLLEERHYLLYYAFLHIDIYNRSYWLSIKYIFSNKWVFVNDNIKMDKKWKIKIPKIVHYFICYTFNIWRYNNEGFNKT